LILIVGTISDPHVKSVVNEISLMGTEYVILDRFDFAAKTGTVSLTITSNAELTVGSGPVLECVSSIWWRQKPPFKIPSETVSDYYDSVFSTQEWANIQRYIEYKLQGVFAINDVGKSAIANNKLYQLEKAASVGFKTPRTVVTNNFKAVEDFIYLVSPSDAIFKTLTPYMNPTGSLTYTSVINKETILEKKDSISVAPGIFQEYIKKKTELRITVVGSNIFAAKVNTPAGIEKQVDWRENIFEDIYEIFNTPEAFNNRLISLHRVLGLVYGAYDFILDEDDEFIFLEVNPSGQWLWLEKKLNFPISKSIADLLISGTW